ncbi:hypothetical protein [Lysinibacillus xylanilyticus]|uniref:hypothetical protein n=1 Tax=Lysinibacillus xylanilyticus TaxID=582475 RepID=UPI00083C97C2|nr:hypothetical protein [Lysinibacillus xylanilyticus]
MFFVRKRSANVATATRFFCAKAKRQQHVFSVRKRSDSNMFFLCESEATATCFFCAKAKRQQHVFSVRKRSDSNTNTMLAGVLIDHFYPSQ